MSSGITDTDNVVLHRKPAWHKMGIVIQGEAPTPHEGLTQAGIDWGVEQRDLFTYDSKGSVIPIASLVGNYRADTGSLLGIVTKGYIPIQNVELADFCSALIEAGKGIVRCESIGTLFGGKRIWFLLKGELFEVAKGDQVYPYILASNGHDGLTTFRITPTYIRVVCRNTMGMVIPESDDGAIGLSAISFRHSTHVMDRVEEAKKALSEYGKTLMKSKEVINSLVSKEVSQADVQKFFLESYTADFGDIPAEIKDRKDERKRERALSAYNSFSKRFDDERQVAGTNYWNALNAYTGLVQHDLKARGKDDTDRVEKRVQSNLFGLANDRTEAAVKRAYSMSLA